MSERGGLKTPRGFPLGALFLLIALVAVVAAQLSWLASGHYVTPPELATAVGLGGVSGLLFGLIIGLYHFRRWRGAFIGVGSGCIFGALSGPICAVAIRFPWTTFCTSLAGGIALIAFAAIYQAINCNDPVAKRSDYAELLEEDKSG